METIFLDKFVVTHPLQLNPVNLVQLLVGDRVAQAHFKTAVVATYHPNVPADTPGEVYLALTAEPTTYSKDLAIANPMVCCPVWRKKSLTIPRRLLQSTNWSKRNTAAKWLCSNAKTGTITVTCTIRATRLLTQQELEETNPKPPTRVVIDAVVGPRIAGFSLCFYGEDYPQISQYGGQVINIDFARSKGWTTSARYVRTPEDKPYVVVRYGWYRYTNVYNSANQNLSWHSNSYVTKEYNNTSNSNPGYRPDQYASWAKIRGSTSWWCETRPDKYNPNSGTHTPLYRCYSVLYLYYDYGDVDIFGSDFRVSADILPAPCQPELAPDLEIGKLVPLTLNGYEVRLLQSSALNPELKPQDYELLSDAQWANILCKPNKRNIVPCPDCTKEE